MAVEDAGQTLEWHETIGSTNAHALSIAASAAAEGRHVHWVLAGRQTSGRGREGRPWQSPAGNFHATLLLIEPCAGRQAAKLGFVAGVSLHQALSALCPGLSGLALKWPNDLLLDGAKLAGILLEAQFLPGEPRRLAVAVGMGVNLAFAPEGLPYPATSLAAAGRPIAIPDLLAELSPRFSTYLANFRRDDGFEAVRDEWLARAHGLGRPVRVHLNGETLDGAFDGLDAEGRLRLSLAGATKGVRLIDAGDVYFSGASALGA